MQAYASQRFEPRGVLKVPYELTDTDYAWVKHHLDLADQRCIRNESEIGCAFPAPRPMRSDGGPAVIESRT